MITGGTGFVGANLARKLLASGCEVHMLVRPGYNPWRIDSIRHEVHIWETELVDGERLKSIAATIRPEWVFHLAAYGAYPFQQDLHTMLQTNVIGTVNMLSLIHIPSPRDCS